MPSSARPRMARMEGIRADTRATQIRAKVTHQCPRSELGKTVLVNVTYVDLPELRNLVNFLENRGALYK